MLMLRHETGFAIGWRGVGGQQSLGWLVPRVDRGEGRGVGFPPSVPGCWLWFGFPMGGRLARIFVI